MYPISNAVKALFDAEQAKVLRITGTDKNGTSISITDADVRSFSVDRYSCVGEKLEIGTAIAAEMDMTLENANGAFDSIVFEGAELFVEIGIADWSLTTPTISYIPIGYFTPDKQPRKRSIITIKALDRMTLFDKIPPTLTPWTDNNGNVMTDGNGTEIDFSAEFGFPCTVAELIEQCCIRCQMSFTQDVSTLPNAGLTLSDMPSLQQSITYRTVIQWCAGIMGTCAYIDWNGNLKFGWYTSANYICTQANRFSSDLHEDDISITGVGYMNTSGATLVSGSGDYCVELTGNYLAAEQISTILPALNTALNGFTYRPFEASVIAAPYLWPLDIITFTDKDGNDHNCILTNVNFGLNSSTALAGKGETAQINGDEQPSGVTPDQAYLIEKVSESIEQLDDSLTQEEIFNRLTDNGETQGILLYQGKIYLNASYIRAGTIIADIIKGGIISDLNGNSLWNLTDGTIDLNGSFTSTATDFADDTYKVEINAGEIKIYYMADDESDFSLVGTFGFRPSSAGFGLYNPNGGSVGISSGVSSTDYGTAGASVVTQGTGANGEITIYGNDLVVWKHGELPISGANGSFTTADGKTVTVTMGIITSIA